MKYHHLNPAIEMADAYGDMTKGMHGTFGKFQTNFDAGFHTPTGVNHGIVIKGTMTDPFRNEKKPPKMETGSYWYVPAGSVHSTACVFDVPCESYYYYADEKFHFFPLN